MPADRSRHSVANLRGVAMLNVIATNATYDVKLMQCSDTGEIRICDGHGWYKGKPIKELPYQQLLGLFPEHGDLMDCEDYQV
jgi:hypothetical protein